MASSSANVGFTGGAGTGNVGASTRSATLPPANAPQAKANPTPWPFTTRPTDFVRRYDRVKTPDGTRSHSPRHGSGARFEQRPSSPRSHTPADQSQTRHHGGSRERVPSVAELVSSPLAQRQMDREQASLSMELERLKSAVQVLQDQQRVTHSRLVALETSSKEILEFSKDLERRSKEALTSAEQAHRDLEKKTSEAFSKADTTYSKNDDVNRKFGILEMELGQLWDRLRGNEQSSSENARPEPAVAQPAPESATPTTSWWRSPSAPVQTGPAAAAVDRPIPDHLEGRTGQAETVMELARLQAINKFLSGLTWVQDQPTVEAVLWDRWIRCRMLNRTHGEQHVSPQDFARPIQ